MPEIRAEHFSMGGRRRKPRGMDSTPIDGETKAALTDVALSIFADMTNNGWTFQEALLAVYLSGLQNGIAARSPTGDETP